MIGPEPLYGTLLRHVRAMSREKVDVALVGMTVHGFHVSSGLPIDVLVPDRAIREQIVSVTDELLDAVITDSQKN